MTRAIKPNLLAFFLLFGVLFAACAPAPKAVPATEPIFYDGALDNVYAAVVQAISTSTGIDNSTGWAITQSDTAGGFIRAETTVDEYGFLGNVTKVPESISVILSNNGQNRTQVIIQPSAGATSLAERLQEQLDLKFLRL